MRRQVYLLMNLVGSGQIEGIHYYYRVICGGRFPTRSVALLEN